MGRGSNNNDSQGHPINSRQIIFATKWFELVAKTLPTSFDREPYFALEQLDYVCILAMTSDQRILLVRQFRPAVEEMTLELPAGHVERGETPEEAARRELLEETGHVVDNLELLGCLQPDTGRLSNRQWCFWAHPVRPCSDLYEQEAGLQLVTCADGDLKEMVLQSRFVHALHLSSIFLAVLLEKIRW